MDRSCVAGLVLRFWGGGRGGGLGMAKGPPSFRFFLET